MEKVTQLISAEAIDKRICEIAEEINTQYSGKTVTLVCVLKGAVMFMTDLARKITVPAELGFVDVSSYGNSTVSTGVIKINMDLDHPIEGKHVIVIDDIIDTGRTLSNLFTHMQAQRPASLRLCVLLDKPERRVVTDVSVDYFGFVVPDKFVVGYGLDYAQRYRNLPYIGELQL